MYCIFPTFPTSFQAGASHVYAVEASWEMAAAARQIVADNGLAGVVTVIQGRVEDAEIPVGEDVSFRVFRAR